MLCNKMDFIWRGGICLSFHDTAWRVPLPLSSWKCSVIKSVLWENLIALLFLWYHAKISSSELHNFSFSNIRCKISMLVHTWHQWKVHPWTSILGNAERTAFQSCCLKVHHNLLLYMYNMFVVLPLITNLLPKNVGSWLTSLLASLPRSCLCLSSWSKVRQGSKDSGNYPDPFVRNW
jgi:hypothetical protein